MAAPEIRLRQLQRFDQPCRRLDLIVGHQFAEVYLLLADDGFVAVLKEMTDPLVTPVEVLRITGEQTTHAGGDVEQDLRMVRHEEESVDARPRSLGLQSHAIENRLPAGIVPNDSPPSLPPDDYMVQGSWCVKSRSSRNRVLSFKYQSIHLSTVVSGKK